MAKFEAGTSGNSRGRPKGAKNKTTVAMKEFLQWLDSPAYRENAMRRILRGRAPHLELLWFHYHAGKPVATVKIEPATIPAFEIIVTDYIAGTETSSNVPGMRPLRIDKVSTRAELLAAMGDRDVDADDQEREI